MYNFIRIIVFFIKWHNFNAVILFNVLITSDKELYIDHNHIRLLVTLLCMVNTPESPHCRPVPVWHIRLPHFAAAIKCRDLESGIGYSTLPYFGQLGRFWYSALTPSYSINISFIQKGTLQRTSKYSYSYTWSRLIC